MASTLRQSQLYLAYLHELAFNLQICKANKRRILRKKEAGMETAKTQRQGLLKEVEEESKPSKSSHVIGRTSLTSLISHLEMSTGQTITFLKLCINICTELGHTLLHNPLCIPMLGLKAVIL